MNVLEKILEEIMQYTADVYECDLDDIVEYQRRNREDKCTYIVQGIEEATEFIRSHMDEREVFEFDFNRVKTFDCQCGRHYVNTYKSGWIPVGERLPEEHDSIFKKFKGTDKWHVGMFEERSDEVIVTIEFEDGIRKTTRSYTLDGKWKMENWGQSC